MAHRRHGGAAHITVSLAQRTRQIILKKQCEAHYIVGSIIKRVALGGA